MLSNKTFLDFVALQNLFFFFSKDDSFVRMKKEKNWEGLKRLVDNRDAARKLYREQLAKEISPLVKTLVLGHDLHEGEFLPLSIDLSTKLEYALAPYEFASYMLFLEADLLKSVEALVWANFEDAYRISIERFKKLFSVHKGEANQDYYEDKVGRFMEAHHSKARQYLETKLGSHETPQLQGLK